MRHEEILTHNRAFLAGRAATPLPRAEPLPLAVVACYDPRLDSLLRDALGLAPTEAFLFRVAGALLRPNSYSLRSLANSVYFFGVSEVMVVGHTSCRMAAFSTSEYIDAFRKRGVPREAFGSEDLREWAGAIASPRAGVLRSVDALAAANYLPRDLRVSGVVLDDASGALEEVSPPATLSERAGLPAFDSSRAADAAVDSTADADTDAPPATQAPAEAPDPFSREIEEMREFVQLLDSTSGWKDELARVRKEMGSQRNPLRKLEVLEKFVRRATVNAREVAATFDRLKHETASRTKGFDLDQLVSLFFKKGSRRPER